MPGTGPELLGNLRQVDALLVVLDGFSGTRVPADDLETLKLELLVADRDHVERRLERVEKQAKSGDAKLRGRGRASCSSSSRTSTPAARSPTGRTSCRTSWSRSRPSRCSSSRTAPAASTSSSRPSWRSSPPRRRPHSAAGASALGEVARRLAEALDLITFFTAGEKETRAWTLRRGETALDAAETIHSDIARGFIRCEVIRWDDLVGRRLHAEASRAGKQRLEGKTYVVEDGDVLNVRFNV